MPRLDLLIFFQKGGRILDSLILLVSSFLNDFLSVPSISKQSLKDSNTSDSTITLSISSSIPPKWAIAWILQGIFIPLLFILLPIIAVLYPAPCTSMIIVLSLLNTLFQAGMTNFKDLSDHVLLGPRGASSDFYDGPPGQRVKRVATAVIISTIAYFVSIHFGGYWHVFALCVTALTPLVPAYATAKFIEGGMTEKRMRARLWQWWWAS